MSLSFVANSFLKPYLRGIAKSIFKPSTVVRVSVADFLAMYGVDKIKTFVSIGANDGKKNDPIAKFISRWEGIMVEPMPSNFEKLTKNYEGATNLRFENAGIGNTSGIMNFYFIKDSMPGDSDWIDQVSSFDKEIFYKNISVAPSLLERVGVMELPLMTFGDLMVKHGYKNVDLVMIDTEGYDYNVLQSVDFSIYQPKIIIFETDWLVQYEYKMAMSKLRKAGYKLYFSGIDCIAVRN